MSNALMPTTAGWCCSTAPMKRGSDTVAKIDDFKTGTLQQHRDEVLANVMNVAFNRANNDRGNVPLSSAARAV